MDIQEKSLDADNLTGENHEGSRANSPVRILTATSIIGDRVENRQGEDLGKIKDIMLDIHRGNVEYVVLEYGGFLGLGEKLFAIPFRSLELAEGHVFKMNTSKQQLEEAPGFDKDHWPETNSHEYYGRAGSYWGNFMGPNTGSSL
ncbi:MAG: PRC-barrel domain-containing protein [Ferruginibacter sp.]|nr:PRC-barrel domain-containing protein [Cytophagales bacterium]